jgi:hypothetical protein
LLERGKDQTDADRQRDDGNAICADGGENRDRLEVDVEEVQNRREVLDEDCRPKVLDGQEDVEERAEVDVRSPVKLG